MSFIAVSLLVSLQLPAQLSAQRNADENHSHPQYKLVDMGTFGGPNSYFFSDTVVESVNNQGTVVGGGAPEASTIHNLHCSADEISDSQAEASRFRQTSATLQLTSKRQPGTLLRSWFAAPSVN